MKRMFAAALILLVACAQSQAVLAQQTPTAAAAARAAIDQARTVFVDAYAAGNVDAVMAAFHRDATYAGTVQPFWVKGEAELRELWQRFFTAWPLRRIIFRNADTQFYGDNTAVETGYMEMWMGPSDARQLIPTFIRYSITRVREGDRWLIVNMNSARLQGDPSNR